MKDNKIEPYQDNRQRDFEREEAYIRAKKRVEKYNSNGFYDLNLGSNWQSLVYGYTHTYHIEFLGKKIEY